MEGERNTSVSSWRGQCSWGGLTVDQTSGRGVGELSVSPRLPQESSAARSPLIGDDVPVYRTGMSGGASGPVRCNEDGVVHGASNTGIW